MYTRDLPKESGYSEGKRVTAALSANNVPCCLTGLVRMPDPGKWSECVSLAASGSGL